MLLYAGDGDVLGDSLLFLSLPFENGGQARVRHFVHGLYACYAPPRVYGLVDVAGARIQFCGAHRGFGGFVGAAQVFQYLRNAFQGNRVPRRKAGGLRVVLQCLLIPLGLIQRQPQVDHPYRIFRHDFQRLAVKLSSLFPVLLPGSGVPLIHQFAKTLFGSGHALFSVVKRHFP